MIYIGWGEITRKQCCGFCEMDCLFVTILSNVFWLSKSEKLSTVLKVDGDTFPTNWWIKHIRKQGEDCQVGENRKRNLVMR